MGDHGHNTEGCSCKYCYPEGWLMETAIENRKQYQELQKALDLNKYTKNHCKNSKLRRLDRNELKICRDENGKHYIKELVPINFSLCFCEKCFQVKENSVENTALGKITSSAIRREGEHLSWYVTISMWEHGCSDHKQSMEFLASSMSAANVTDFNDMLGQPILAIVDSNVTKNWRILKEVK